MPALAAMPRRRAARAGRAALTLALVLGCAGAAVAASGVLRPSPQANRRPPSAARRSWPHRARISPSPRHHKRVVHRHRRRHHAARRRLAVAPRRLVAAAPARTGSCRARRPCAPGPPRQQPSAGPQARSRAGRVPARRLAAAGRECAVRRARPPAPAAIAVSALQDHHRRRRARAGTRSDRRRDEPARPDVPRVDHPGSRRAGGGQRRHVALRRRPDGRALRQRRAASCPAMPTAPSAMSSRST